MAARWTILVGVAAISGGIAWFALRDGGSSAEDPAKIAPEGSTHLGAGAGATTSAAGSGSAGRTGKIDQTPLQRPLAAGSAAALAPQNTAFEAEDRDPSWAPETEADIKARFKYLRGGRLDAVECRQDQCLLTMSGTEEEMSRTIAELETPAGLRDYAERILLGGPEVANGKMTLKVTAYFDRSAKPN